MIVFNSKFEKRAMESITQHAWVHLHLPKVDSTQDGYVPIGDNVVTVDRCWMQHILRGYIDLIR